MAYSTFRLEKNNQLIEPMFLGKTVNVSRFDQQRHPCFESLIEKQLSFFWRPEEVDISKDRSDWQGLSSIEKHIYISNLKYQTLLDSVAARSVNVCLLPLASLPEMETWIETWAFSETIHSRSYTHILRNLFADPGVVFEDIMINANIIDRATDLTRHFDALILMSQIYFSQGEGNVTIDGHVIQVTRRKIKSELYLVICAINALEAIRFYVSFACTFSFSERELLEGNAKIVKLIARDEALHLTGTQQILNMWSNDRDDPEMAEIAAELHSDGLKLFLDVVEQEKTWADYLFKDGAMIGLNATLLKQYVEYIANQRLLAIGYQAPFPIQTNPLPWMDAYLRSDNVQVAPQESEISSYLVGQLDSSVNSGDFSAFAL